MLYMILLRALLIYFDTKVINRIELYKPIKQNGDHLIFYQYYANALFSLVRLAVIIMLFVVYFYLFIQFIHKGIHMQWNGT